MLFVPAQHLGPIADSFLDSRVIHVDRLMAQKVADKSCQLS